MDDHTVVIETDRPHAILLHDLVSVWIISRKHGTGASMADYNSGKAAIGTGPYKVDSFQRGSGPAFSLLPPENATGNFVKVVQRVPVKIVFDDPPDPGRPLGPGMSVVPRVKVR